MAIQNLLKDARNALGLTQKEIGSLLGISGSLIAQYETGVRNPKIETLRQIVNVFVSLLPISTNDMPASDLETIRAAYASIIQLSQETSMLESARGIEPNISGYERFYDFWAEEFDTDFFPGQWHYIKTYRDTETLERSAEILKSFALLNDTGKQVAIDRVNELTEIKRYTD